MGGSFFFEGLNINFIKKDRLARQKSRCTQRLYYIA